MKRLLLLGAVITLAACNDQTINSPVQPLNIAPNTKVSNHWNWLDSYKEVPFTADSDLMRKNYVFVFDGSGSMDGDRIIVAKKAAKVFSEKVTNDDNLGLVVFDTRSIEVRVGLSTNNKDTFNQAIDQVEAGGGTPLESAIVVAYNMLSKQGSKQRGYGEYNIIVVTDGEASIGQDPGNMVRHIVSNSPINVYSIGFQFDGNHSLNQKGYTTYYQADNYDQLIQSFNAILAESNNFDPATFE